MLAAESAITRLDFDCLHTPEGFTMLHLSWRNFISLISNWFAVHFRPYQTFIQLMLMQAEHPTWCLVLKVFHR